MSNVTASAVGLFDVDWDEVLRDDSWQRQLFEIRRMTTLLTPPHSNWRYRSWPVVNDAIDSTCVEVIPKARRLARE